MNKIKRLSKADHNDIFALSQYAFQYELSPEELEKKKEEAERHTIWGWMENQQIAAKLHLIPLSVYINGEVFEMGGVSAVATWPEHRRNGAVKNLLHHALQHMKENGQVLSFLHPFAFTFYRKYGWEHAFNEKHYTIPIGKLKNKWRTNGYVSRTNWDISTLNTIYSDYAKGFNGTLVRDERWWEQRVLKGNWHTAVAYDQCGEAMGYVIYNVKDNKCTIHDFAYTTLNGQKLLLEFIANHDSMAESVEMVVPENDNLPLLVSEPKFEQKIEPYFMARIVDVLQFLEQYPFSGQAAQQLTISVEDAFLPENTGTYQLKHNGEKMQVSCASQLDCNAGLHLNVQYLTSMFMGFKRPTELYEAGLIEGDETVVKQLESVIPVSQTFLSDFY